MLARYFSPQEISAKRPYVALSCEENIQFPLAPKGESVSSPVTGAVLERIPFWFPATTFTNIALEMGGPIAVPESGALLIRENAAWHSTRPDDRRHIWLRDSFIRKVFAPEDCFWHGAFWSRTRNVVEQAIAGLAEEVYG